MDDGYLFFRVDPVETAVYNDTIDYEIRMVEGPQARIKNVTIAGNEKTKDYVIRRELRTIPGELFNRSEVIRSVRELGNLQYFNQEKINPGVVPNAEDGTVDINWTLEEKSSDQLELSAGWGGGIGLTGTLGVSFNNFSIKNIFNKEACSQTSIPKMGVPFTSATSIKGLSWLGVEDISSFPSFTINQAQPLPNLVVPAVLNFSWNASKDPNASLIASPSLPEGLPPAFGPKISQKKL